jgi:hypothetical protein
MRYQVTRQTCLSCRLLISGKKGRRAELHCQRKRATTKTKKVKKKLMKSNLQETMEAELGSNPNKVKSREEIRNEVFFDTVRLIQDEKDTALRIRTTFPKGRW